jgi:hypothetical protein
LRVIAESRAFAPLPVSIGSLSRLEREDALSAVLSPLRGELAFSHGTVNAVRARLTKYAEQFAMSMRVREGDSGSPIFAYENGRPVLIGIVTAYIEDNARDFYISIGTGVGLFNKIILADKRVQVSGMH